MHIRFPEWSLSSVVRLFSLTSTLYHRVNDTMVHSTFISPPSPPPPPSLPSLLFRLLPRLLYTSLYQHIFSRDSTRLLLRDTTFFPYCLKKVRDKEIWVSQHRKWIHSSCPRLSPLFSDDRHWIMTLPYNEAEPTRYYYSSDVEQLFFFFHSFSSFLRSQNLLFLSFLPFRPISISFSSHLDASSL